jgi:hypothetical protein
VLLQVPAEEAAADEQPPAEHPRSAGQDAKVLAPAAAKLAGRPAVTTGKQQAGPSSTAPGRGRGGAASGRGLEAGRGRAGPRPARGREGGRGRAMPMHGRQPTPPPMHNGAPLHTFTLICKVLFLSCP